MFGRLFKEIAPRLIQYKLSYHGLIRPPAPINLTYSITNKCNSRCRSCDIWKIYPAEKDRLKDELDLDQIEKLFQSVGPVYFFNISGGEPFLRKDIDQIILLACRYLKPSVVHVPTNALLPRRILQQTEHILSRMKDEGFGHIKLTLKPSMDGVGDDHDWVRGVRGNWDKLLETVEGLKALQKDWPTLGVGVGTVISTMNIHKLPETIRAAEALNVDTYISEVAEERLEMRNATTGITPDHARYRTAIRPFQRSTRQRMESLAGLELLTQGMRHYYYDMTARWLQERRQIIPCYAGISNVHISAYGEVWPCAVLADSNALGNVKDHDYDFWKVWHGEAATDVRQSIKRGACDCPLANQAYANILLSPKALTEVATHMATARLKGALRNLGILDTDPQTPEAERATPAPATRTELHPFDTSYPDVTTLVRHDVTTLHGSALPGPPQPDSPVGILHAPTGPNAGRTILSR
ncbi:MAG: radical SAM protein [Bradymonadaceae bacterium]|nr:radical SAM protein [Lujinxingiaceae bacterium]